jgi:hypothetical protein
MATNDIGFAAHRYSEILPMMATAGLAQAMTCPVYTSLVVLLFAKPKAQGWLGGDDRMLSTCARP